MNESINNNSSTSRVKNEESNFSRVSKELKILLFGVLNLLLKEDEISVYISGLLAIIEVTQSAIFLFHPQAYFINH